MAKILIIDDRPLNRQFLTTLLGYQRHDLCEASDGADGLRVAREQRPDLIISDVLMPTMDGYEFVRRLREDPTVGKTTVIFSTAHYLSRESQALAEKCGVSSIIYKPCEPEMVLSIVDAALQNNGVLHKIETPAEEFDREHVQLLTDKLSEKAAHLRDSNGKLRALIELSTDLSKERNPVKLLDRYCSAVREIVGCRWTLVALLAGDRKEIQHLGGVGLELNDSPALRRALMETGTFAMLMSEGRSITISGITSTPGAMELPVPLPRADSLLATPLWIRGEIYGWICLADKLGLDAFSEQDEQLVTALAGKMAVAYDNARLYEESTRYAAELEIEISEREKIELELIENRARLAGIIGSAMDAIITVDSEQRVVIFNDAAEKMFRCNAGEAIGQPIENFIPERLRGIHSSHIDHFGHTGVTTPGMAVARTVYGLRADGQEFPIEASISQIDVQGQKLYTVIMRDITERVRSWERFTQVIERAPNGMVMVDQQGSITMVNAQMEQLFGYERAELLGKQVEMLVPVRFHTHHGADREEFMHRPAARPMGAGRDLFGRHKDGSEIPVEIGLNPIETDQGMMVLGTVVDITERKQAEAALKEAHDRLEKTVATTPGVVCSFRRRPDGSSSVSYGAERIEELYGLIPGSLASDASPFFNQSHPDDVGPMNEAVAESAKTLTAWRFEWRVRNPKRGEIWLEGHSMPLREPDGSTLWHGVVTDITERKHAEEELQAANKHLQQALNELRAKRDELAGMTQQLWQTSKLATMGELAASIAHELNNPLTTVTLSVEALMMELAEDEKKAPILQTVRSESERMADLVGNLLQFSRRSQAQISTLDLAEELGSALNLIDYHLRGHNVRVVQNAAPNLPQVNADRQQLLQVFLNLLTNACDAMPGGGTLGLSLRPDSINEQPAVLIEFADAGIGIEEEDLERIWEPFVTTKPEGKGTGLGLPICRRTIEEHGGSISINSKVGSGTTVIIKLPVTPPADQ